MKTPGLNWIMLLFFLVSGVTTAFSQQDRIEVPGDHFSLEGALELFKKSSSPEEFERLLNSRDTKVNNLDLNGDGYIDYIRVIDRTEGNVHAFILQAVISESEYQDVAVIELEKLANGKAVLQITGDEDVYGIETIIEPTEEVRINAGATTTRTVVNVWTWPAVQYIYSPRYVVWVSPWRWTYYPVWWRSWRPVAYYVYDPWWRPYRHHYSVCHTHRIVRARHIYRPYRTTSVVVYNRHNHQIKHYRSTYSHHDGRDRRDNGRTRYDGNHSNGRQYNNVNERTRSDIRYSSPSNTRGQQQEKAVNTRQPTRREVSTPTRSYNSNTNTSTNVTRDYSGQRYTQPERTRTFNGNSTQNKEVKRPATTREYSSPNRSGSRFENNPGTSQRNSIQRQQHSTPQRSSGAFNRSTPSRQPVVKPSAPVQQRSSSGNTSFRRSGSSGGEQSSGQKRGRQ